MGTADSGRTTPDPGDTDVVWLPLAEFDGTFREALFQALEPGQTYGFNYGAEGDRIWVKAYPQDRGGPPQDTHALVRRARALLGR